MCGTERVNPDRFLLSEACIHSLKEFHHSKQDATKKKKRSPGFSNLPQIFLDFFSSFPQQWGKKRLSCSLQATACWRTVFTKVKFSKCSFMQGMSGDVCCGTTARL